MLGDQSRATKFAIVVSHCVFLLGAVWADNDSETEPHFAKGYFCRQNAAASASQV